MILKFLPALFISSLFLSQIHLMANAKADVSTTAKTNEDRSRRRNVSISTMKVRKFRFASGASVDPLLVQSEFAESQKNGLLWELNDVRIFQKVGGKLRLLYTGTRATLFQSQNTLILDTGKTSLQLSL